MWALQLFRLKLQGGQEGLSNLLSTSRQVRIPPCLTYIISLIFLHF